MRAEDRRAHILSCARQVFARRGFHPTSVADICAAAGIARGTLYQYFDNKREVFVAVVQELLDRVRAVIAQRVPVADVDGADAAPPKLILGYCERRLRRILDAVFADEASLRLLLREARGLDGGIDALIGELDGIVLGALEADLRAAAAIGVIDCPEPRLTALFVLGGIEKMCLSALAADAPVDLDAIVRVATRLELYGLLSEATRRMEGPR